MYIRHLHRERHRHLGLRRGRHGAVGAPPPPQQDAAGRSPTEQGAPDPNPEHLVNWRV